MAPKEPRILGGRDSLGACELRPTIAPRTRIVVGSSVPGADTNHTRREEVPVAGQPHAQAVVHVGCRVHEMRINGADRLVDLPRNQHDIAVERVYLCRVSGRQNAVVSHRMPIAPPQARLADQGSARIRHGADHDCVTHARVGNLEQIVHRGRG
jgi:hypothetical protein